MPTETTFGRAVIEAVLPDELKHAAGVLDKKGVGRLFQLVAETRPDLYRDINKKLNDISSKAAYESGTYSFGPEHLAPPPEVTAVRDQLRDKTRVVLLDRTLTPKRRDAELVKLALEHMKPLEDATMSAAVAANNPLALQVLSGAKGKPENLKSLIAGDTLYADQANRPVPFPVLSSFYEGLQPHEFFGSTFGARSGLVTLKLGTAQGGWFGKRLAQASHRLVVTAPDGDDPHTGHGPRGLPVPLDDPDNEGALLAHPAGSHPRDTVLTREVIGELKRQGVKDVLVRSAAVGGPPDGGVYGNDVGVRERGTISPVGDYVGLNAASSISEPSTQSLICLAAGTEVRMADGTVRAVEDVCPGEEVLGVDANPYGTPCQRPVKVVARFDNGERRCYRYRFETSYHYGRSGGHPRMLYLECTPEHRVLSDSTEFDCGVKVRPVGCDHIDFMLVAAFDPGTNVVAWASRQDDPIDLGMVPTFDLEVDHPDHLFVLANGLVVSNSSKHGGGVAGSSKGQMGFPVLDRLISIPGNFPGGATHAQLDGTVTAVADAPQGGKYVTVDGVRHYAAPDVDVTAKVGDRVEAGDVLTDGTPRPDQFVHHKGIGEGRRRFVDAFMEASKAAGFRPHRRNLELVARGLIDHVELHAEVGDHVPGDVVSYTALAHDYRPRDGHETTEPKYAVGKYLERPVLHHTIGTRVTPSMLPALERYGVGKLTVHAQPPPFTPTMIRSQATLAHDQDPLTQMLGSGLEANLLKSVHRGASSDLAGTSFVPALAAGVEFGQKGKTVGFDPSKLTPPVPPR